MGRVLAVDLGIATRDRGVDDATVARADEVAATLGGEGGARVRVDLRANVVGDRDRSHLFAMLAIQRAAARPPRQYASAVASPSALGHHGGLG